MADAPCSSAELAARRRTAVHGAGSEPFSFVVEPTGSTVVLRVAGEFDILGAVAIRDAVGLIVPSDVEVMRVDCAALTFMDSTAVTALLELRDRVTESGGRFSVERLPAAQREMLAMAGLLEHLQPAPPGE